MRKVSIKLPQSIDDAVQADADANHGGNVSRAIVATLARRHRLRVPEYQQGFAADGGAAARAAVKNPGRKPRPKE